MSDIRPQASPPPRTNRSMLLVLKFLVAGGVIAWILHDLDFTTTGAILKTFPPILFIVAIVIQITMQTLQALRWKILTGRVDIPYRDFLGFVSLGYVLSILSPSVLVSDSANAWLMGKRNQSVVLSISAMVAGRILGLVGMFLLFLVAVPGHLWVFRLPIFESEVRTLWIIPAAVAAAFLTAWLIIRVRPAWLETVMDRGSKIWAQATQVFGRRQAVISGLLLSIMLQILQMSLPWLGFHAMDIPVGFTDVMFFIPLVTLISLIPGLGQIGVREGIVFVVFSLIPGVTREHIAASFGYNYALFAVMGVLNLGFATWILHLHRSGGKLYRWFFPARGDRNPS